MVPSHAVTQQKEEGGAGHRRRSSHLCPTAIDPANHHLCEKKPWAPARPASSALPPLPRVASSLCSPPTPPSFKFCRYGSVQQPPPARKRGREGNIRVELRYPSPPGTPAPLAYPPGPAFSAGNLPFPPPRTPITAFLPLLLCRSRLKKGAVGWNECLSGCISGLMGVKCKSLCG